MINDHKIKIISDAFAEDMYKINNDLFYCAFKGYFQNRADFDECLNILGNDKEKIIRLGFFYYVVVKEIKHAGITLISIFSIMEATSKNKFQPFDQWLLGKIKESGNISYPIDDSSSLKDTILELKDKYYKEHGSSEKVRSFIKKYFDSKDKQTLISGFQIKDSSCDLSSLGFEEQLKAIVDMLYKERNAFVHEGRLPQITYQNNRMLGYCKIKSRYKYVSIQISINEIQRMFENGFINFIKKKNA